MTVELLGGMAFGLGLVAAVATQLRVALVCLWGASLCVAGIFLGLGAEFLALCLALLSTILAMVLVFHTELFGRRERIPNWLIAVVAFLLGDAFVVIVWACVHPVAGGVGMGQDGAALQDTATVSLASLGQTLVHDHILSVELMAIILLSVVVGLGVVSRPEARKK